MRRRWTAGSILALAVAVHPAVAGLTTLVPPGGAAASGAALSGDGRFVAFASAVSTFVPGDTNGTYDVFVYDRDMATTTRMSVASDGAEGNGLSEMPAVSADGRFVAFDSLATNLVPGDTNGQLDVFVHDRQTGETTRVSVATDGSEANGPSNRASISADGRVVAFVSQASNLVPNDTNGELDVFVHDRQTGETTRVSVASDGSEANSNSAEPAISADGRFVAFSSTASNLIPADRNFSGDIFVRDRATGAIERVSVSSSGGSSSGRSVSPAISADGRFVAFRSLSSTLVPGDTNGSDEYYEGQDAFVHDRLTGETTRVSVMTGGFQGNGDENLYAFHSVAISGDGRFVAFDTGSPLAPGDTNGLTDVFLHDRASGVTTRVSVSSTGRQSDSDSVGPAISADGRFVAFTSAASTLVPGGGGKWEVFVHEPTCGDGVVDPAEECDDGNLVSGDGCEPDCTLTICGGGREIARPTITLRNPDSPAGDAQLMLKGGLAFPPGIPPSFNPIANGAQVLLEDLGTGRTAVFELTHRTVPVPSGGPGSGCDPVGDGWIAAGTVNTAAYTYTNRSTAIDVPRCTAGSARGLFRLTLLDRRTRAGEIRFLLRTRHSSMDRLLGPLRMTIVLGKAIADSISGACATHAFASCSSSASTLTCK